jgi:hypothetical protein
MARLFADENFSQPVIEELRRLGHDVLTVAEIGLANQRWPDDEVLQRATDEARAVLTHNRRHFFRLHRARPQHAGIVACTVSPNPEDMARRIHESIAQRDSLAGELIRIYRGDRGM